MTDAVRHFTIDVDDPRNGSALDRLHPGATMTLFVKVATDRNAASSAAIAARSADGDTVIVRILTEDGNETQRWAWNDLRHLVHGRRTTGRHKCVPKPPVT